MNVGYSSVWIRVGFGELTNPTPISLSRFGIRKMPEKERNITKSSSFSNLFSSNFRVPFRVPVQRGFLAGSSKKKEQTLPFSRSAAALTFRSLLIRFCFVGCRVVALSRCRVYNLATIAV